jgi:hypothetical protein
LVLQIASRIGSFAGQRPAKRPLACANASTGSRAATPRRIRSNRRSDTIPIVAGGPRFSRTPFFAYRRARIRRALVPGTARRAAKRKRFSLSRLLTGTPNTWTVSPGDGSSRSAGREGRMLQCSKEISSERQFDP